MDYVIRSCDSGDLDALVVLCGKHAAYEKSQYSNNGKVERLIEGLFAMNPPLHCLVVESSKNLIGYCSYTFDFSTWDAGYFLHLDCLFIEEDFRGMSIGEKLIRQIISIARQRKCVNVQWQTPAFNEDAIRFYKRMGATAQEKQRFTFDLREDWVSETK